MADGIERGMEGSDEGGAAPAAPIFLGWDHPPLHAAADLLLANISPDGAADFTRHLVVLPGARAGRRLVELLLERCEAARRPLRPPRVASIGALPELLYRASLPPPSAVLDRLAWGQAVGETPQARLDLVFPNLAEGAEVEALALARTIQALSDEIGAAAKAFSDLIGTCREHRLYNDEERWSVLAEIQERHDRILREVGFQSRDTARREALAGGVLDLASEIWVIGVPELPIVAREFLERLAEWGVLRILVTAPEGLRDRFDGLGCVAPDCWATVMAEIPDERIRVAPDPEGQARTVAARLGQLEGGVAAEDIVVGVPDPDVIPHLVERLGEAGVTARDASGTPVEGTSPFRLLEAIAEYVESNEFDRLAALLRHPEFEVALRQEHFESKGIDPPGSFAAAADSYREMHLPLRLPARGDPPSGGERDSEPLAPLLREVREGVDKLLRSLRRAAPLSSWSDPIAELFLELFGTEPVHRHSPDERGLAEFAETLGRVLHELEEIPSALDSRISGDRALRFVLDAMRGGSIPPLQDEEAIELLGWLELPLDDAPVLIVTGANEPHLPKSQGADPFLPHGMRKAIGLLDNEGRWARDLFHLRTILATRRDVLLVAGRRDAAGNPLRLSRLLLAEPVGILARRLLAFLDAGTDQPGEGAESSVEKGGELEEDGGAPVRLPPDPRLSAPAPVGAIRVTDLRLILSDPYGFALARVLGLEAQDDEARELDGAGFGTLAHEVLRQFGAGPAAAAEDEVEIRDDLDKILDRESASRFGAHVLPAVRIQVEQLRLRLHGFARWQADWTREGWRIAGVEVAPAGDGVAFDVDGESILLRGKVDRVDHNVRTGEWCVLDYKSGEGGLDPEAAHRKGRTDAKEWVDLQLPLYRRLVPALRASDGEPLVPRAKWEGVRVGYVVLARDAEQIGVRFAEWSADELAQAEEVARSAVRTLRGNQFPFDPTRSAIRSDDPLAAVIGGAVLRLGEEDDGSD